MATVSFTTQIDLTGSNNLFIFTDTSDYAGQGINTVDVNGSFRIIDPNGLTIYNNTDFTNSGCDIDVATSLISQQTISFTPVLGTYTILYTVDDTNAVAQYTVTNTYDYKYVAPVLEISQTVDCITPIWSQNDITVYDIDGVSPTTNVVCNQLHYPVGSAGFNAPIILTASSLSTGVFYRGTQTSVLTATLTYDFADGLQVNDFIELNKEFNVNCDYYCSILCCIQAQEQLMTSYRGNNQVLFKEQEQIFVKVNSYVALIRLAIECGNGPTNQVSFYLDEIRSLTRCTSDCDCEGDDNSRVIGFGAIIGIDGTNGTNGLDGAAGAAGANGVAVLFNSTTVDTPVTGAYQSLKSFTMPAATLPTDGDAIMIMFTGESAGTPGTGEFASFKLNIDSSTANPKIAPPTFNDFALFGQESLFALVATVTRLSSTTVMIKYSSENSVDGVFDRTNGYSFVEETITVSDLTLNSNLIDMQGFATAAITVVGKQLMITQLLKP